VAEEEGPEQKKKDLRLHVTNIYTSGDKGKKYRKFPGLCREGLKKKQSIIIRKVISSGKKGVRFFRTSKSRGKLPGGTLVPWDGKKRNEVSSATGEYFPEEKINIQEGRGTPHNL